MVNGIKAVLGGEIVSLPVSDGTSVGFRRVPAPCDGFLIDVGDTFVFVPRTMQQNADADMRLRIRNRR